MEKKYRGVHRNPDHPANPYRGKKWLAQIRYNGKQHNLIYTDDMEKAAQAYDTFAKYYHGDKAVLNFPNK